MKVIIRLEVDDDSRRAMRISTDTKGFATRKEVVGMVYQIIDAHLTDLRFDAGMVDDGERRDEETPAK